MAAVELPGGRIQDCERPSRYRQVNGEVAAFVRVCMQAAEAQVLVTKQSLGSAVSRKALMCVRLDHPLLREPVISPGSAQATARRRRLISRDGEQPEDVLNSETEGLSRGAARMAVRVQLFFASSTGPATSECGQATPEAGSR